MYSNELTYEEQLEDERWQEVRNRILRRDKHTCQLCGAKENLNVHHRYYIFQHEPWAYYDNALITLCQSCHKMVHDTLPSIVYAQNGRVLKPMRFTPCVRCGGFGYLSEYKHVQNGICFRCKGLKYEELINKSIYSADEYIDNRSKVYDSIDSIDTDEAEMIFQKGKSLHKDNPNEAKKYYLRVAKLGYGKAQNNLGLLLQDEGDFEGAKRWLLYSAMQGIEQGKNNLIGLLLKTDEDNHVVRLWSNLMLDNKDFQCRIAFKVLTEFLDNTIDENNKPSVKSVISSMDILTNLASGGHNLSKRLVNEYKIDVVYKEFLSKLANGEFEEEIEANDTSIQCNQTEKDILKSEIDEKNALYSQIKELEDWLGISHNPKILEQPYDIMNDYLCDLETKRWEVAYSEIENTEQPSETQGEDEAFCSISDREDINNRTIPTPVEKLWMSVDAFFENNQIIKGHKKFKIRTIVNESGVAFNELGLTSHDDVDGIEYSYFVLSKDLVKKGYVLNKAFLKENKKRIRVLLPQDMSHSELGIESKFGWIYLSDDE